MKKMAKIYDTPEVSIFEVVAERGYENSTLFTIPGMGTDEDTWV